MPTLQGQDVSSSEDSLDAESREESVTVTPPTLPHDDGSSCIFPSTGEEILAGSVESTYALTLPEQDYLKVPAHIWCHTTALMSHPALCHLVM